MANNSLEEILNVGAAAGPFGVGDSVLEQTLRDFIQLQSNRLAIGTDLIGVRSVPWLEFKWYTGVDGSFTFPLDDAAVAVKKDGESIGPFIDDAENEVGCDAGGVFGLEEEVMDVNDNEVFENMEREEVIVNILPSPAKPSQRRSLRNSYALPELVPGVHKSKRQRRWTCESRDEA